jgi:type IV pilus assembly protein PilE
MKPVSASASGFSLIELLVAMGVVGILAAIAVPAYSGYAQQSRRTDATRALSTARQVLERCYTLNYSYSTGCPALATSSPNGYYAIGFSAGPTATTYTLQATAQGIQAKDTACVTFKIDNTGLQTSTGTATALTCWGSN